MTVSVAPVFGQRRTRPSSTIASEFTRSREQQITTIGRRIPIRNWAERNSYRRNTATAAAGVAIGIVISINGRNVGDSLIGNVIAIEVDKISSYGMRFGSLGQLRKSGEIHSCAFGGDRWHGEHLGARAPWLTS